MIALYVCFHVCSLKILVYSLKQMCVRRVEEFALGFATNEDSAFAHIIVLL